jgi:hypothetical protein
MDAPLPQPDWNENPYQKKTCVHPRSPLQGVSLQNPDHNINLLRDIKRGCPLRDSLPTFQPLKT